MMAINFSSVKLDYNDIINEIVDFKDVIYPRYSVKTVDKTTTVKINGMKNLRVDKIIIETDSTFKRNVFFDNKVTKVLYNLEFKDTAYKDTTLSLYEYEIKTNTAELIIQNGDDKPINISKIWVEYFIDELVFEGSIDKGFTLRFGNTEKTEPLVYDIENYKEEIIKEGYDILKINKIYKNPTESPKQVYDYKWIFNLIVIIVAIVMGILIFLKIKKNRKISLLFLLECCKKATKGKCAIILYLNKVFLLIKQNTS